MLGPKYEEKMHCLISTALLLCLKTFSPATEITFRPSSVSILED